MMTQRKPTMLRSVKDEPLPEPPYPASTKGNGWSPEVDWQRIKSSRTWRKCPRDMRNALLRIWLESWNEVPVGSWEADDELIADAIDVEPRTFAANRSFLLAGWSLHSDGRLYHPTITEMVEKMRSKRSMSAERVQKYRDKKKQQLAEDVTRYKGDVTRYQRVSNAQELELELESNTHPADESAEVRTSTRAAAAHDESREESTTEDVSSTAGDVSRDRTPYAEILRLWREQLPELCSHQDVSHWTSARKQQIRARWRNELPDMDAWRECFALIRASPFLMGRTQGRNGRPFRCDLFWITKPENLLKLYEGKYDG